MEGREAEWDSRWWSPIINAEHLAMRDRAGMFDLTAFCVFDVVGPGALESVQRVSMRQMDVKLGKVVYTPGPHPRRRLPLGPHRHAPRRRALPGGHGRRARHGRPEGIRRRAAGGRHRADLRPHLELVHARPVGAAGPRHPRGPRPATTSRTRASRSPPAARSRWAPCGCSPRASPTSATSAGSSTCRSSRARGCGTWWPEAGEPHGIVPVGHRRVRDHRAPGEVLPGVRLRARRRVRRGRGRDGLGQGQGAGLHRQGGARAPAGGGSGHRHVHAHGRRPHVEQRREALHARR